jgi:hypothetical protein
VGIEQMCGKDTRVQRCRIQKIRNITDGLPKERGEQVRWLMKQACKLDTARAEPPLTELAREPKVGIRVNQSSAEGLIRPGRP